MSSTGETVMWLCAVFVLVIGTQTSTAITPKCSILTNKPELNNISVYQVFSSDDHLDICVNNDSTCCTQKMEQHLHKVSKEALLNIRTTKTDLIRRIFSEGRTEFNDFFEDLINDSEKELKRAFLGIYKSAYVNNSYITKEFYAKLRKLYSKGELNANQIVEDFFATILKKMFVFYNPGVNIDLDCVGSTLNTLNPFGTVPRMLISQITRSFTAARTLVLGMLTGKTVVDKLTQDDLPEKCLKSVTKMAQCSLCDGYDNLKPCVGYCKSVYDDCFNSLKDVEHKWNEYLKRLQNLALMLEGRYNIEAVTGDLPYDISSGITNYAKHAASGTFSDKIKQGCQKGVKRTGRSLTSSDGDFFLENSVREKRSATKKGRTTPKKLTLDSLTETYREHFERLKKFWSKLPDTMCDQTVVADNVTDKHCWDGSRLVNNTKSVQQRVGTHQQVKSGKTDATVRSMINLLKSTIEIVDAAASGKSVPVWPTGNPSLSGDDLSGSGSGSGWENSGEEIEETGDPTTGTTYPTEKSVGEPKGTGCVSGCDDILDKNVLGVGNGATYFCTSLFILITTSLLHLIM